MAIQEFAALGMDPTNQPLLPTSPLTVWSTLTSYIEKSKGGKA